MNENKNVKILLYGNSNFEGIILWELATNGQNFFKIAALKESIILYFATKQKSEYMMRSNEKEQTALKPIIIANPIYDTVFKRLMENLRIVKFFISTILGQQVTAVDVLPQEFTHKKKNDDKVDDATKKEDKTVPYSIYRVDFMATVLTKEGEYRKVLIEVQKSLGTIDVHRFRKYLGEQYAKRDTVIIDNINRELMLPITTIYILGDKLAEIKCSCLKVGRIYTDMLTNETVTGRDDFIEKLTHDSYIIQAGRITDNRYITNLEKLISIFEQKYFLKEGSEAIKEYWYQPAPNDEEMILITNTLHEMGVNPEERKQIENEAEYIRTIDDIYGVKIREQAIALEESKNALEESKKALEESKKALEEKDKKLEEQAKKIAEMERFLRNKQVE
ncbi:MAG: hypothetical protein LBG28_16255 [Tannerella sp.]|jgi:hypothetical protein|nr:hypothetical protein [Tannerella sp.]